MANDHIERVSESGELEAWEREIEGDLRGVVAVQVDTDGDWLWRVGAAVAGMPSGEALVGAVGAAIDPLVERASTHLENLS